MKKTVKINETDILEVDLKVNGREATAEEEAGAPSFFTIKYNPYGRNELCANIYFKSNGEAVRYSYTVIGRTPEADFTYSSDVYAVDPVLPVIGFFATRETRIELTWTTRTGIVYSGHYLVSHHWQTVDFGNHYLKANFEITDEDMANSSIANGWLFNGYYGDVYDINGDVRVLGILDQTHPNLPMKVHNNLFYVPTVELGGVYYTNQYDKLTLMGENKGTIYAPEGHGFHHDLTWDEDGYVYCLASTIEEPTVEQKVEGIILKYVDATGELVSSIDYTTLYVGTSTCLFSGPNDVHFNSIEYVPEVDQLLVNSRNSSSYFGVDKRTLLPIWTVENPIHEKMVLPSLYNLTVVNPDEFTHISGGHTVFVTKVPKYEAYRGENKLVLSIFDNVACVDEQGNELFAPNEDTTWEDAGYKWDSAAQIVAIDLNKRTVEQLDRFTIPGERSDITSDVFDTDDHKYLQYYVGVPTDYFVIDAQDGRIGVTAKQVRVDLDPSYIYRGRVLSFPVIKTLVEGKAYTGK